VRPLPRAAEQPATSYQPEVQAQQDELATNKGRVLGDNVYIREMPSLKADIIKLAMQGDIVDLLSFANGWYKISLENHKSGYIFGAFLSPLDFDSYPFRPGMMKDQNKVLLKVDGPTGYYQLIYPDGRKGLIRTEDVSILKPE
jgi:uncharacterized protein YgiM (DUF1202 family)